MKKIKSLLFVLLPIGILLVSWTLYSASIKPSKIWLIYTKGDTYKKEWTKVDSLEQSGLTKSALEAVKKIYAKAKQDNNSPQLVKALIVKTKFQSYIEENAFVNSINELQAEAAEATYPLKPVLHSIIADLYWQYYRNNRWKFQNRTETVSFKNDDITTWDLKKLTDVTVKNYLASIKDIDNLKRTPINTFEDILKEISGAEKHRPYLYDFLAHRAVDFFMNDESSITKPVYEFVLDNPAYLASKEKFMEQDITSKDTLSLKYYALKTLQSLIVVHANDEDPIALIDVELKRLKWVKNNAVFEGVDNLYYKTLINLEKKYTTYSASSEINFEIANVHYLKGRKYDPLKGEENKWELKKALDICLEVIKKYPKSYGASQCKSLESQIKEKSIHVVVEKVNTPNLPLRGKITHKNLSKVYFRLLKVKVSDYRKWQSVNGRNKRLDKIKSGSLVKEWSLDLKDEKDYQTHSGEFKVDELLLGYYVLLTSTSKEFTYEKEAVSVTPFWVSNLSYLNRKNNKEENEFFVLNREAGHPMEGVKVELFRRKYSYTTNRYEEKKVSTYYTNEEGSFKILPIKDYHNFYVHLSFKEDYLSTRDSYYQYGMNNNTTQENKMRPRTVFFTDRAIYRPGQTIYFKGISLELGKDNHNRIVPNSTTSVVFYDVNNQKIAEQTLTSNEYGTFSGTFTAPSGGMNGQMRIANSSGGHSFSVEEYKRPKFEVKFKPIKGSYKLEKNVSVKGLAKTYSGAALDEAEVKYRVVRNASFPYWGYYYWSYYPTSAQMEIVNGTTQTKDDGTFDIDFIAKSDKAVKQKYSPTYSYTVYADVIDVNGETHSATTYVYVGYNTLKINVDLPDPLNKNDKDIFNFSTTNLNGEPEPAKGNVKVWALKMPNNYFRASLWGKGDQHFLSKEDYNKAFSHDVYADENNRYKWEKNIKVYDRDFNTAIKNKIELYKLPEWNSGYYVLEATTIDKFGKEVKEVKYFTVYGEHEKSVPVNEIRWITPVKNQGEPGEVATFLIGSAAKDVKVLYEIEHKGELVHKEWISLKGGEQRKITIPIEEKHRGNFQVHFMFVKHGRSFVYTGNVTVPYTNMQLDIEFETFRDKLTPGQEEEWKIKIKGKKGEKVAAEMVATLYDASLDAFRTNYWGLNILNYTYSGYYWQQGSVFSSARSELFSDSWNYHYSYTSRRYTTLNWFGYYYSNYNGYSYRGKSLSRVAYSVAADEVVMEDAEVASVATEKALPAPEWEKEKFGESKDKVGKQEGGELDDSKDGGFGEVKARKNFNETAFFYPHLATNEQGEIEIKFTIPEALTKWKFMGLAHTKDLKTGMIYEETVTQKELMVYPNAPRFFRENDELVFSTKIVNLSDKDLKGGAKILFFDALTMQPIDKELLKGSSEVSFEVKKGKSTKVEWELKIPEGFSAITYRVLAKAGNFSDGEEMAVPVLTNRMLVTESMPLPIRGNQTKTFQFKKLVNNSSKTLNHYKLTLEFTSNPAWYAVQALPYLMEYPYECSEQTFSRFYANSIASHIANSNPKIKAVFDSWKNSSPDVFLSNLEKNQELKSVILEETPWVLNAKSESERKKRVGLLFDLNKMSNELSRALKKLQQMQLSNGGWPWFKGMRESRYITQHVVTGMGHLDNLGVKNVRQDAKTWEMVRKATLYLDNKIREDYDWLKKHSNNISDDHISYNQIQYLYARSYFINDIKVDKRNQEAFEYYKGQAAKYWLKKSRYMQGMIALALNRFNPDKEGKYVEDKIMASLKENSIEHEEMGMYWKDNTSGYYWYQAPIETQALLIEAFDEVANDQESVESMKVWLLKQKQTQDWRTTKATTEACYALLLKGADLLASDELVEITLGDMKIDPKKMDGVKVEAGTGYFKTSWGKGDIKSNMGNVTVTKKDAGVAWGALYWQYFEQLDKITPHETPLKLEKKLFLQKNSDTGPVITPITNKTKLQPGDKIKVRIELRVDRNMEYVHMKDMRAAGFEPINVFSGYRYQDGLGYYESTKDASTNFFFDYLPKGTYVFEYPLRVNMSGDFSNGITSIQCMYAPEFTSHSEGIRVNIGRK